MVVYLRPGIYIHDIDGNVIKQIGGEEVVEITFVKADNQDDSNWPIWTTSNFLNHRRALKIGQKVAAQFPCSFVGIKHYRENDTQSDGKPIFRFKGDGEEAMFLFYASCGSFDP